MIQHTVLWKLVDMDEAARTEFIAESARRIDAMSNIPGVVSISALVDVQSTDGNWDLGLVSVHDDEAALAAYQVHPDHTGFGGWFKPQVAARVCIDSSL
ncbi:MAG: hypothetical protein RL431_533 [Actinomycetota bacterium]|jgi:hypothetical protein